jgi:hypothetical protein
MHPPMLPLVIALCVLGSPQLLAQRSETPISFEVASIKVNKTGARLGSFEVLPGGEKLVARNWALSALIMKAYDIYQTSSREVRRPCL